jgi:hypothetical protein
MTEENIPAPSAEERTHVARLLAEAGLAPSAEEIDAFTSSYAMLRSGIATLYSVPEARYEVPALVFSPEPTFEEWGR